MVVTSLPAIENQVETKHVETLSFPRLDEGSNPSSSTTYNRKWLIKSRLRFSFLAYPPFIPSFLQCESELLNQVEELAKVADSVRNVSKSGTSRIRGIGAGDMIHKSLIPNCFVIHLSHSLPSGLWPPPLGQGRSDSFPILGEQLNAPNFNRGQLRGSCLK